MKLEEAGIRTELDETNETVGRKIRNAELKKIPYILIIGDKEIEADKVALRRSGDGDKGQVELKKIIDEVKNL